MRRGSAGQAAALSVWTVALAATASCSLAFQEPTLRVTEVTVTSLDLTGGTAVVVLDVENPNPFGLTSREFRYNLAVAGDTVDAAAGDWTELVRGARLDAVEIPGGETRSVRLETPFEYASVGRALLRLLRSGSLEYRFFGSIRFDTPIGEVGAPFDERGTFRP